MGEIFDVCMLTTAHRVSDSRIWAQEAKSLRKKFARVAILGPSGDVPADDEIEFRVFKRQRGLVGRLLAPLKLLRLAWETPARVYHCHELDAALMAILIKMMRPCKVIFDSHELFREVISLRFPRVFRPVVKGLIFLFECFLYKVCDGLVTVADTMADRLSLATGRKRPVVIYNASGVDLIGKGPCAFSDSSRRIICLGNVSMRRGITEMCRAVEIVHRRRGNIVFYVIGSIDSEAWKWLERFRAEHGLTDVIRTVGYVAFYDLGKYLPYADVGIMAYKHSENVNVTIPVKLLDYMAFGVPSVACDTIEVRRLNREYEVALLVDTTRPEEIADAIIRLLDDEALRRRLSENALRAVREKYSWKHMEQRLFDLYDSLLGDRPKALTGH